MQMKMKLPGCDMMTGLNMIIKKKLNNNTYRIILYRVCCLKLHLNLKFVIVKVFLRVYKLSLIFFYLCKVDEI